jgi:hypothetical protein
MARSCLMRAGGLLVGLLTIHISGRAGADVPTYRTFELQARANFCVNPGGAFVTPCDVFFANGTPVLNDAGEYTIKLDVIGGTSSQGAWFGAKQAGTIGYTSSADASLSDPWINNDGYVVVPQTFSPTNGLYYYDSDIPQSGLLTTQPFGASSWGAPIVNDNGEVGFRATFTGSGQAFYSYAGGAPTLHAAEAGLDPQSPYSFLFSMSMNGSRQIAAHVRLGAVGQTGNSQPDEIRVFNVDRSSVLIARDVDGDGGSPYSGFDSSRPAINDSGQVAYIATLAAGGRGVFLSDGTTTLTIATTSTPGVTVIDFFPLHVNNDGLVAFRGRDGNGLAAIFVGDGATLRRVIGEHDVVDTDLGDARIDQHDSSPVLGGSITINNDGDVAFQCGLTPPDNNQIEWGSGIFIAHAEPVAVPGDVTGNGVVDIDDLLAVINAWGQMGPPGTIQADVSDDGMVNIDDLLFVINHWG